MHCFSLTHLKQHYDRFLFYMVHTCYWSWFTEWFIIIMCYYSIIMVTMLLFQVCTPTQTIVLLILLNGLTVQQTKHLLVQTITNFYHITLSVKLFKSSNFLRYSFYYWYSRGYYVFLHCMKQTSILYPVQFLKQSPSQKSLNIANWWYRLTIRILREKSIVDFLFKYIIWRKKKLNWSNFTFVE